MYFLLKVSDAAAEAGALGLMPSTDIQPMVSR